MIDPESADVVREIFATHSTGAHSFKSLARRLNARGIKPPQHHNVGRGARPSGSPDRAPLFTSDSLKDVIGNMRYTGKLPQRDGSLVQGTFPAIIDQATWDECERIRIRKRFTAQRTQGVSKPGSPYLLSGVLRCAAPQRTMSGLTRTPDRLHS